MKIRVDIGREVHHYVFGFGMESNIAISTSQICICNPTQYIGHTSPEGHISYSFFHFNPFVLLIEVLSFSIG